MVPIFAAFHSRFSPSCKHTGELPWFPSLVGNHAIHWNSAPKSWNLLQIISDIKKVHWNPLQNHENALESSPNHEKSVGIPLQNHEIQWKSSPQSWKAIKNPLQHHGIQWKSSPQPRIPLQILSRNSQGYPGTLRHLSETLRNTPETLQKLSGNF